MLTEVGKLEIEVPRDRDGSFKPQIAKKRQRRLIGVDEGSRSLPAAVSPARRFSRHSAGTRVRRGLLTIAIGAAVEAFVVRTLAAVGAGV